MISLPNIIHIFGQTPHHYVPMRQFLEKATDPAAFTQEYWAWSHPQQTKLDTFTYYHDSAMLTNMMRSQPATSRFIFHGFMDRSVWPKLAFSSLVRRCAWICWGTELYQHKKPVRSVKLRIMHLLHSIIANRLKIKFALNQGDAELIGSILFTRKAGVLPYPLIAASGLASREHGNTVQILVGNSAAPSNNHIAALKLLEPFSDHDIRITVPLNYGGEQAYVEQVMNYGKAAFGDKFVAVTHMLQKQEYDDLLANTDVTVFAHDRQQGLYVIYSMLKYGKKTFLNASTSSFTNLRGQGFAVFATEDIAAMTFDEFVALEPADVQQNSQLMEQTFSETALTPKWRLAMQALIN